jgi:hypothetical protein
MCGTPPDCWPVVTGSLLFLHFHHPVAGTLYKVVEVEPSAGVVNESTEVVLDAAPEGFTNGIGLDITFEDLGGLDREIAQLKELVQLPLRFPGIYRQIGIAPVRGVILYGPPGTGKTLLRPGCNPGLLQPKPGIAVFTRAFLRALAFKAPRARQYLKLQDGRSITVTMRGIRAL